MKRDLLSLTVLARTGFSDLGTVRDGLDELAERTALDADEARTMFADAADPDVALAQVLACCGARIAVIGREGAGETDEV